MVVIGKADELAVRAEDVHVAAAAQRAGGEGRGNIHCIEIAYLPLCSNHPLAVMKIVLPVGIRMVWAVDKDVLIFHRMYGHDPNMRAVCGAINHLYFTRFDVNPLNGVAGKRCPGRADVKDQPLAVCSPGAGVGELMVAGSEGDLFHEDTLMRGCRIRV